MSAEGWAISGGVSSLTWRAAHPVRVGAGGKSSSRAVDMTAGMTGADARLCLAAQLAVRSESRVDSDR